MDCALDVPAPEVFFHTRDCFVLAEIGDVRIATEVKHDTLNPVWNEDISFDLSQDDALDKLKISLCDHDIDGEYSVLGTVHIDIPKEAGSELEVEAEIGGNVRFSLTREERQDDTWLRGVTLGQSTIDY